MSSHSVTRVSIPRYQSTGEPGSWLNWIAQIVLNGQPANVDWVFVDGQPRKARGRLVGVDPARIVQAAEAAARRIGQDLHLP
jgi:hypothetical protein